MKNLVIKQEGNKLTIEIDTSQKQGLSSSGKSYIVATTGKPVSVGKTADGFEVFLGLTAFYYPPRK